MGANPVDAQLIWAGLTDVEKTCVQVAFMRWQGSQVRHWPDGRPWYTDPFGKLFVDRCVPVEEQQKMAGWSSQQYGRIFDFVAVRTTELDSLIAAALYAAGSSGTNAEARQQPIQQLVMLGAGMDTRAWRMRWPPGFKVFEVDSRAVLNFKSRVMSGAVATQQQQQQHETTDGLAAEGLPKLGCEKRVEVVADAGKPEELWDELLSLGFAAEQPTLWLLEGFIGYLTPEAGTKLLCHLAASSAPNSRIIMTAPPVPNEAAVTARLPACLPAVMKKLVEGLVMKIVQALMVLGIVRPKKNIPKLYHATKELPTTTLKRMEAAGWQECTLLTSQQIAAKYGTEIAQPILLGRV